MLRKKNEYKWLLFVAALRVKLVLFKRNYRLLHSIANMLYKCYMLTLVYIYEYIYIKIHTHVVCIYIYLHICYTHLLYTCVVLYTIEHTFVIYMC